MSGRDDTTTVWDLWLVACRGNEDRATTIVGDFRREFSCRYDRVWTCKLEPRSRMSANAWYVGEVTILLGRPGGECPSCSDSCIQSYEWSGSVHSHDHVGGIIMSVFEAQVVLGGSTTTAGTNQARAGSSVLAGSLSLLSTSSSSTSA